MCPAFYAPPVLSFTAEDVPGSPSGSVSPRHSRALCGVPAILVPLPRGGPQRRRGGPQSHLMPTARSGPLGLNSSMGLQAKAQCPAEWRGDLCTCVRLAAPRAALRRSSERFRRLLRVCRREWRVARAGTRPGLALARIPFGPCTGNPLIVTLRRGREEAARMCRPDRPRPARPGLCRESVLRAARCEPLGAASVIVPASCITSRRILYMPSIPRHRLVLRTESFPVCATTRKATMRRVRPPHSCEEDAHAPMGSKSPAFKGRASPLTRDLCNIRVYAGSSRPLRFARHRHSARGAVSSLSTPANGLELRGRWPSLDPSSGISRRTLQGFSARSLVHSTSQAFGALPVRAIHRLRFSTATSISDGSASTFATMYLVRSTVRRSICGALSPGLAPKCLFA